MINPATFILWPFCTYRDLNKDINALEDLISTKPPQLKPSKYRTRQRKTEALTQYNYQKQRNQLESMMDEQESDGALDEAGDKDIQNAPHHADEKKVFLDKD